MRRAQADAMNARAAEVNAVTPRARVTLSLSKPMQAIVLTCDRYRRLAEHMVAAYARWWPDHPLTFRVAVQEMPLAAPAGVIYCPCPRPIKATVLALIADLGDDEWVYWCIDDKYPMQLDLPAARDALAWVMGGAAGVDGVLLCRCRDLLRDRSLTGARVSDPAGNVYLERRGYQQIWLHQFLRVKVLRELFGGFPDEIPHAKLMDGLKDAARKPAAHRLYVARENRAVYGESTSRGLLTANCAADLRASGLEAPDWFAGETAPARTMGTLPAANWWRRATLGFANTRF